MSLFSDKVYHKARELKFGELAVHVYKKTHWKFGCCRLLHKKNLNGVAYYAKKF